MGAPGFSETLSLAVASGASQEPAVETAVPQASSSGSLVVMYSEAAPKMTWGHVRQEVMNPHFIEEEAQVTNSVPAGLTPVICYFVSFQKYIRCSPFHRPLHLNLTF